MISKRVVFSATLIVAGFAFSLAFAAEPTAPLTAGFKSADEKACAGMLGLTGTSINDATRTTLINPETCAAYRFLLERNGTGTRGTQCYKSQSDRILKLNPGFAVGLYKSLAEIEKLTGRKNIVQSGFRCDGTNGHHTKGCAVDIIWGSCQGKGDAWRCSSDRFDAPEQKWIDANGRSAPYNIHLRLRFAPEGHHVEPVNTQGCVTGVVSGSAAPPSSAFTSAIREALGLNQSPQQPPPPPPPMQQQPLQQGQQPTQYFPQQTTGTPSSSGSSGQSPVTALSPTSQAYLGVTDTGDKYQPSISEQLLQMAYGTTSQTPPQNTGTTVPLYLSPTDVGTVQVQNPNSVSTTSPVAQNVPIGTLQPSQTFTSQDLSYAPSVPQTYTPPPTGMFAIFETLKTILLRMLEILRPMGIRDALQGDVEHEYEYDG